MARTPDNGSLDEAKAMRLRVTVGIVMGIFGVVLVVVLLAVNS